MKAAQVNQYGDPSVIMINEVTTPIVGKGQVLVEVHAASLNPFDTIIRSGYLKEIIPLQFPFTLGGDIAGVVSALGAGVTSVNVGDVVYGQANVVAGNSGAFAEFATTAASQVALAPNGISHLQAASLPLTGASALQALSQHIKLAPGQKIFIHGGAGSIGSIAIQIAKHMGAFVATTATAEGFAEVKMLGADEVIDYKQQDFATIIRDYDAVFDTVGGDDFEKSLTILRPGGIAVTMAAQVNEAVAADRGVTALSQMTRVTTDILDELRQLVEAGVVTPRIGKVFPLSQIREAFIARETSAIRGKIVVEIKNDHTVS